MGETSQHECSLRLPLEKMLVVSPTRRIVEGPLPLALTARARHSAPSSPLAPVSLVLLARTSMAVAVAVLLPRRKGKAKREGNCEKKPAVAAPAASILKVHIPKVVPGNVALAASYDHGPTEDCRSWLLDTGCTYDLTTRSAVPQRLQNSISRLLCLSPSLPPTTSPMVIW